MNEPKKGFFDDDPTYEKISDEELAKRGVTLPESTDGAFFDEINQMLYEVFSEEK